MPQMAEMMARSDRAQLQHAAEHKSLSKHGAGGSGFSPPMMSKAQVVYYLCRGGKMEPPHMIEVPHSHYDGLRLRDVKHRLTILRGGGMPNMFSWSYKRMYKNTHIWQDVCDDDSLTPVSGGEYILKGSEYFESSQEKSSKSSSQAQADARSQELLQRKFRGAETWLKASGPLSPKGARDQNCQTGGYDKLGENCVVQTAASQLRNLGLENVKRPLNAEGLSASSDEYCTKTSSGGGYPEDAGMHDIKVCEVRSPAAMAAEHACSVATQTEESNGYGYGPPQDYKSSGSSTPTCFGRIAEQQQQVANGAMPVGKSSKGQSGKLKRRLGKHQPQGKESGPKVKMKHGAASCVFLHILSYCGGVDTKMQSSAPPTEIASSEYSFDGMCRAENKLVTSQTRSPQYSMELHKDHHHQLPYQGLDNNRSGPLIPYSSEYFDVKEAVSPLQSSPLQGKSSKGVSSNLDEGEVFQEGPTSNEVHGADDPKVDESYVNPYGADRGGGTATGRDIAPEIVAIGGVRDHRDGGAAQNEWTWSSCPGFDAEATVAADLRPLQHWNRNLRLSKRRFFRHWWQALFQSLQAQVLVTRTWPKHRQPERQVSTKGFFVGKCRRSRARPLGY